MYRSLLLLATVPLIGVLVVRETWHDPIPDHINLIEIYLFNHQTQQKLLARKQFQEVFQAALKELAQGEVTLPEASARVYYAAQMFSPTYLRRLAALEPNKPAQFCVARNLVGHVGNRTPGEPDFAVPVANLERQLKRMEEESEKPAGREIMATW